MVDIGMFWWIDAYVGKTNLKDPFVSPILGDLKGIPPVLIQVSSTEMLYGGCKKFAEKAKAAGIKVTF